MISIEDCIALSALTEEEIEAIAEHERIPEMVATELGNYMLHRADGVKVMKRMILDDIEEARKDGNVRHAAELKLVLRHFLEHHAQGAPEFC